MSKPSIKFIYSGQIRSPVQRIQRGPAQLNNFSDSFTRPEYVQIPIERNTQPYFNNPPIVSNVQINSKPATPSSMTRYRSAENFNIGRMDQEFKSGNPILNIQEINESQMKIKDIRRQQNKKSRQAGESDQIVLKAPSYRYTPKQQGEIAVHSKKEFKKTVSVDKCLVEQTTLKSRKPPKNSNTGKQIQLKSSNLVDKIETVKQSDFIKQISKKQVNIDDVNFNQIVLKAPKYKYTPRNDGDVVVNRKKQYVKGEYAQKYLYQGVQQHHKTDFIACFGCNKPPAKIYAAEEQD